MARKIWTAAEVEKMTPAERHEVSQTIEILDPTDFPELLERARESIRQRMNTPPSQRRGWPAEKIVIEVATVDRPLSHRYSVLFETKGHPPWFSIDALKVHLRSMTSGHCALAGRKSSNIGA